MNENNSCLSIRRRTGQLLPYKNLHFQRRLMPEMRVVNGLKSVQSFSRNLFRREKRGEVLRAILLVLVSTMQI
jgi:hypothetical protein